MYFTVWEEPAPVLYRMGGAGSGTLPFGRSRLMYFTVWEESAPVRYRLGGAGSGTLSLGGVWLMYFTVWAEPAPVLPGEKLFNDTVVLQSS